MTYLVIFKKPIRCTIDLRTVYECYPVWDSISPCYDNKFEIGVKLYYFGKGVGCDGKAKEAWRSRVLYCRHYFLIYLY